MSFIYSFGQEKGKNIKDTAIDFKICKSIWAVNLWNLENIKNNINSISGQCLHSFVSSI